MRGPLIKPQLAVTIPIEEAPAPRHAGKGRGRTARARVQPQPRSVDQPQEEAPEVETIETVIPLAPSAIYAQLSIRLHIYHQSGGSGGRAVLPNVSIAAHFVTPQY